MRNSSTLQKIYIKKPLHRTNFVTLPFIIKSPIRSNQYLINALCHKSLMCFFYTEKKTTPNKDTIQLFKKITEIPSSAFREFFFSISIPSS